MHYYQKNIADYRKDTGHLSLLEHGIYNQVMDTYYLEEKPIETQSVIRRLSIKTEEEKLALENILNDFFVRSECGNFWRHKRIDTEIEKYHAKAETAKANGRKGGRPKKPKKTNPVNLANPGKTGSKANHKPRTNNQELNNNNAYAFCGERIRLNHGHYEKFKAEYSNLDLDSELKQLDLELLNETDKNWFMALNAKLNYRNRNHAKNRPFSNSRPSLQERTAENAERMDAYIASVEACEQTLGANDTNVWPQVGGQ